MEQGLPDVRVEAHASVTHRQRQQGDAGLGDVVSDFDRNRDLAVERELDGVGKKIGQHLTNAGRVAEEVAPRTGAARDVESETLDLGLDPGGRDHAVQLMLQVHVADRKVQMAGLDLGDIEDVGHQPFQRHAGVFDQLDQFALGRGQLALGQHTDQSDDAVQGRPDLVADIGQKVGLGLVGYLGSGLGIQQFAVGGDAVGDVAGHTIDAVADAARPPLQRAVFAGPVPIAVDEAGHRISRAASLDFNDARLCGSLVVGMEQPKKRLALHLIGAMAEDGFPRRTDANDSPVEFTHHQQVQRDLKEGPQDVQPINVPVNWCRERGHRAGNSYGRKTEALHVEVNNGLRHNYTTAPKTR